jgi:WD40 repeat protein
VGRQPRADTGSAFFLEPSIRLLWLTLRLLSAAQPSQDVPTKASCPITSLSTETDGAIFAAGLGDGTVQLFDKRCAPEESLVRIYDAHKSWVQDVRLQEGGNTLVSGSLDGTVSVWDFRLSSDPISTATVQPGGLSAISTHSHSPFVTSCVGPTTELPGIRGLITDFGSAPLASLSSPVVDNITHRRSQYLDIHYIGTPEPTLVTHRLIPINASAPSRARPFAPWKNALTFHPVRLCCAALGRRASI